MKTRNKLGFSELYGPLPKFEEASGDKKHKTGYTQEETEGESIHVVFRMKPSYGGRSVKKSNMSLLKRGYSNRSDPSPECCQSGTSNKFKKRKKKKGFIPPSEKTIW